MYKYDYQVSLDGYEGKRERPFVLASQNSLPASTINLGVILTEVFDEKMPRT